jgi:hypothetical protein
MLGATTDSRAMSHPAAHNPFSSGQGTRLRACLSMLADTFAARQNRIRI